MQFTRRVRPMTECQHTSCSDDADETIALRGGDEVQLCEDHAHMNPDGTPVGDYQPNDPDKFTAVSAGETDA
jgi:hypothetical protein